MTHSDAPDLLSSFLRSARNLRMRCADVVAGRAGVKRKFRRAVPSAAGSTIPRSSNRSGTSLMDVVVAPVRSDVAAMRNKRNTVTGSSRNGPDSSCSTSTITCTER